MVTRKSKTPKGDIWLNGLIPTVSKPIPTKELINRLLALADHLSALDQASVSPEKYADIAKDLANKKLLNHQNEAVKAHTCCAIADILRINAPDAPYLDEELSRIFRSFFAQLGHAWDTNNSFYAQQSYVLTRLVEVRSIILVVDLPDAAELITLLFDTMYELAAKGFPQKLEQLAADMLAGVIAEAEIIPKNVVSTVFKSLTFTGTSLTGNASNISHPGFTFSVAVCEGNIDKMSRQVAKLFSEMLDESATPTATTTTSTNASFKTLDKIHKWSVQIWKHVPEMLGSIIGLIGDELTSDSEKIRVLATETIGEILAVSENNTSHTNIDSNLIHFFTAHKSTWSSWLKKSADVSASVRCAWATLLPAILDSPSITTEMVNDLRENIKKCLLDSSEKVRLASCKAIESLAFPIFTSKLADEELLQTLFSVLRERDEEIRTLVIRCLCYVYDNFMKLTMEDEVVDFGSLRASEVKRVEHMLRNEFPNKFIQLNYINLVSITTVVDVELFENVIPFLNNATTRCARLCHFFSTLDQKSREAFTAVLSRQKKYSSALTKFIELSDEYHSKEVVEDNKENASDGDVKESKRITDEILRKADKLYQWLSVMMPESFNSRACLEKLFLLNNSRHMKLILNCISSHLDYKTIKNSIKELIVSLNNQKAKKSPKGSATTAEVISTLKLLLYRASPIFFNRTNISEIMMISKDSQHEFHSVANELLELVAASNPEVLRDQLLVMADLLVTDDIYNPKNPLDSILRSIHHYLKTSPKDFPDSLIFTDRLLRLAQEGSPEQAKYSVKILGHHQQKEHFLSEIVSNLLPLDPESAHFTTKLASIAEVSLIEPFAVEDHVGDINNVITEQVLKQNRRPESDNPGVDWITDDDLKLGHQSYELLNEKVLAIRYIVNRIRGLCRSETNNSDAAFVKQFEKPIRLLSLIIATSGEIVRQNDKLNPTPRLYQMRLRLVAGLGILKLAKIPALDVLIDCNILRKTGRLMYDLSKQVREKFMRTLHSCLSSFEIPERFLYLVFMMGHEPDPQLRTRADTWVKSTYQKLDKNNDTTFERSLSRLIHGVAHDEKFLSYSEGVGGDSTSRDFQALEYALKYLNMYLLNIAKDSNISLLYYIASRVKQYRDATLPSKEYELAMIPPAAMRLYRVSELCQLMIKEYADLKNYTLQTWPGKMKLPADLFSPMENFEEALKVLEKQYIEDDLQIQLRGKMKAILGRSTTKRPIGVHPTPAKKRKPNSKTPKQTKKPKQPKESTSKKVSPPRRSSRATKKVTYSYGSGSELSEEEMVSGDDYESDYD
ncbi:hypothetical protein C7M61_005212 [Candidozyma pseudohaemuli]|uniref:Sister chromatid cohesion protein n=1 Tax=Candidozyma pseudohaemuli TaxID=418784 RepID=A0A2P7YCQ7_9ASCO|nr:hypothetical protein C7M61_005212 [[Candida] pseudohaemulonii]PSK33746.1 hypothetical protein C7M61_005212 [[Candida] pseudohaemulonii]